MGIMLYIYARELAEKFAWGIADEHGFDFKRILPRNEILEMIQTSDTSGIDRSDLRNFSIAGPIIEATDADGADCYIVVDASCTVHWDDVERAVRDAELVERFTQRSAHPLVAGIEVDERVRKFAIETGKALWSRMEDRYRVFQED